MISCKELVVNRGLHSRLANEMVDGRGTGRGVWGGGRVLVRLVRGFGLVPVARQSGGRTSPLTAHTLACGLQRLTQIPTRHRCLGRTTKL